MIRSHKLDPIKAKAAGLPQNAIVVSARRVPRFMVVEAQDAVEVSRGDGKFFIQWSWQERFTWKVLDLTGQEVMFHGRPLHVSRTMVWARGKGWVGNALVTAGPFPSEMQPIFCYVQDADPDDVERIWNMLAEGTHATTNRRHAQQPDHRHPAQHQGDPGVPVAQGGGGGAEARPGDAQPRAPRHAWYAQPLSWLRRLLRPSR